MISSMTGYGKSILTENSISVEVEIKSLNSRFLDLSVRLPKSLSSKEIEIRNLLKDRISRGKIILNIYLKNEGVDKNSLGVDETNLDSVITFLNSLKKRAGIDQEISLENILSFQNLLFSDKVEESEDEFKLAVKALHLAIDNLVEMRNVEGNTLVQDLKQRAESINETVSKIESLSPESISDYFTKLRERAKELLQDNGSDEKVKTELALLAEKYDVTEECVRLKSHIEQFLETLKNSTEVGRKLNFLTQEMNREANTINSKSVSTEISYYGIFIKEELEKIREQIQNIE
ncbi:MAG: YicC family protein [Bacteroidetes bacterium]|nr:YicC family protein [Bacteroidota bacterium]MBU1678603.1 YicC family protein [Bacteroidota bacterium]MBU2506825.1 YicC family protein [Bacteroidota bacterium]